jgi:hypothetical protein
MEEGTSPGSKTGASGTKEHTVGVLGADVAGQLDREASLAAAPRAGQGQQPRAAEEVARAGELTLAPDEAGRRARQSRPRAWAQIRIAAEPASISGAAQPSPFMVRLGPPLH